MWTTGSASDALSQLLGANDGFVFVFPVSFCAERFSFDDVTVLVMSAPLSVKVLWGR